MMDSVVEICKFLESGETAKRLADLIITYGSCDVATPWLRFFNGFVPTGSTVLDEDDGFGLTPRQLLLEFRLDDHIGTAFALVDGMKRNYSTETQKLVFTGFDVALSGPESEAEKRSESDLKFEDDSPTRALAEDDNQAEEDLSPLVPSPRDHMGAIEPELREPEAADPVSQKSALNFELLRRINDAPCARCDPGGALVCSVIIVLPIVSHQQLLSSGVAAQSGER